MQDQRDDSGWDDLLSELGADPAPDAFERKQPANSLPEPEIEAYEPSSDASEVHPSESDWAELANQLGIETPIEEEGEAVLGAPEHIDDDFDFGEGEATSAAEGQSSAPEAVEEIEEATADPEPFLGFSEPEEDDSEDELDEFAAAQTEDSATDPDEALDTAFGEVEESSEQEESEDRPRGVAGEAARSAFDALFSRIPSWSRPGSSESEEATEEPVGEQTSGEPDFGEPLSGFGDGIDDAESELGSDAVGEDRESDESDEPSDRPKRRRRRRRGRRGRGGRASDNPAAEDASPDDSDDELRSRDDQDDADDGFGAGIIGSGEEDGGEAEDGEERRPRRRRSRRRRRKPAESGGEAGAVGDSSGLDGGDDADEDGFAEGLGSEDGESRDEAPRRSSHRSIPSWSEAINVIVDANLEGRSRAPSRASSSRGRGGRGGRGGRRRGGGGGGGGGRGDGGSRS